MHFFQIAESKTLEAVTWVIKHFIIQLIHNIYM